ncbi:MAG TPA: VOC family protein [Sphingomicrobium sp.]|nr:VOC family protein [Sphingomicrobium sp.]
MSTTPKPRLVGFNHVAIEVGDIDEALAFYSNLFSFELRSREPGMAFIDLGDQFLALQETSNPSPTGGRHFGLVVEDKEAARQRILAAGIRIEPGPFLDFRDPWGNLVEIVGYENIQFTKADHVLRGMGLSQLRKNDEAISELREKGMAPETELQPS